MKQKNLSKTLSISTQLWIVAAILVLSFGLVIGLYYNKTNKVIKSQSWLIHTHEVLTQLEDIQVELLNLETGQRGFLITGDSTYLSPFKESLVTIYASIEGLRLNTINNPVQTERIDALKEFVDLKIHELNQTITLRRTEGFDAAQAIVLNHSGKKYMERIQGLIDELKVEEQRILQLRSPIPKLQLKENQNLLLFFLGGIVILVSILFLLIINSITKSIDRLKYSADEIGKGNLDYTLNYDKSTELGGLAYSLDSMRVQIQKYLTTNKVLEMEIIEKVSSHKKLEVSRDHLMVKNQELEAFNQIASHDLQEPLNSIIGFTSILDKQKDQLDVSAQKSLDMINGSAQRMKRYVQSLLDYTNIGNESKKTTIDMGELIQKVLDLFEQKIQLSQARIQLEGESFSLMGFEEDLMMLFQNLITNALKYSRDGIQPDIRISLNENDEAFLCSIRDNGIGIPESEYEKIFRIFSRLHTKGSKFAGTGIGLASAKRIVEMHGGKIWLESKLDQGTTFYLEFPKSFQ